MLDVHKNFVWRLFPPASPSLLRVKIGVGTTFAGVNARQQSYTSSVSGAHLVLLAEVLDSSGELVHLGGLAFHHLANIHGDLAHADAMRGHVVSGLVVQVG